MCAAAGSSGTGRRGARTVVLCDVDGTLLGPGHALGARTVDAVRACVAAGAVFALSTGRMYQGALPVAEALGVPCPMVCLSGALVVGSGGELVSSATLDAGTARGVLELIARRWPRMAPSYFAGRCWYADDPAHPAIQREQRAVRTRAVKADLAGLVDSGVLPNKIFCSRSDGIAGESLEMAREIARRFPQTHVIRSASGLMVEVVPAGVDKESGARALLSHLGASMEDAVAFGDDENDVALLRAAGTGVAVGNACAEALRAADETCPGNDREGVADWLERNLPGKRLG